MAGFLIERYWPGVTMDEVTKANELLSTASNADAVFVGSILVPTDEVVLFEFFGSDADAVLDLTHRAGLRCDRIVAVAHLPRGGADPGTELGP